MKYIYNNTQIEQTWKGQIVLPNVYLLLTDISVINSWSLDDDVISDIVSGNIVVSRTDDASGHISDVSDAIGYMKSFIPETIHVSTAPPFATPNINIDGTTKSLYKRVHGINVEIPAGQTGFLDFAVPYPEVKFSGAKIFGCDLKDTLDFFILDTETNTYSQAQGSFYVLNQFGFDVEMPPMGIYENTSNYSASLYAGMIVSCAYKNNGTESKYISMNMWIHEVK